jgi:hypothetical protein
MKVTYTTKNGRMTVEFEVSSQKELFRELHRFQEVFEDTASANVDGQTVTSDDIRYIVRKSDYEDEKGKIKQAEYFEARVGSGKLAGWKKQFGVLDDGTEGLFPKRNLEPNKDIQPGYGGWHKYIGGSH